MVHQKTGFVNVMVHYAGNTILLMTQKKEMGSAICWNLNVEFKSVQWDGMRCKNWKSSRIMKQWHKGKDKELDTGNTIVRQCFKTKDPDEQLFGHLLQSLLRPIRMYRKCISTEEETMASVA